MEPIYIRLGQRIRTERERQGLTQEILAERARLSTAFIGQLERGVNSVSLSSLAKIAQSLGVSLPDLLKDAPHNAYPPPMRAGRKLLSLLRDRPSSEQTYILSTVKALVRRLDRAGKSRPASRRKKRRKG